MEHMCDCCEKVRADSIKTLKNSKGGKVGLFLCNDCSDMIKASDEWVKTSRGNVKYAPDSYEITESDIYYKTSKSGWSSFVKVLNVILFIALIIVGMIVGASIGDAVSYEDAAIALGMFVGLILGALVGAVIVSFSMLFVEISENLAGILEIIKKDR